MLQRRSVQVSAFGKFAAKHERFVEIDDSDDTRALGRTWWRVCRTIRQYVEGGNRRSSDRSTPATDRDAGRNDVVDDGCRALDPRAADAPPAPPTRPQSVDEYAEIDYAKLPVNPSVFIR